MKVTVILIMLNVMLLSIGAYTDTQSLVTLSLFGIILTSVRETIIGAIQGYKEIKEIKKDVSRTIRNSATN